MSRSPLRYWIESLEDRSVPAVAYALSNNALLPFDTSNPTGALAAVPLTGLNAGDNLVGIDFRPQNGLLYGLGYNSGSGTVQLYGLSPRTGTATAIGATIESVTGANFGFDFNPTVDRIRVVNDSGQNFRINPNTGALVGGVFDGAINGGTTKVDAAAYTNNAPNATVTTLYTLDASTDKLFIQNPPNAGTESLPVSVTVGGVTLNFAAANGFDIPTGMNAAANNAVTAGLGFAALTVGASTSLFTIDLTTGAAINQGTIGGGGAAVQGLAVWNDYAGAIPQILLSADGTQLMRSIGGGAVTSVGVTGLVAGEKLVGIDFRPSNGQMFGLGFNQANGTGSATLYQLDPQTGAATIIGIAGGVADGAGNPISLAGATAFGFDFNPTVDRIRVVTNNSLNFRINPNTGAPVLPVDGALSNGATGAAYTNSFAGTTVTTLYTLNPSTNTLSIQNPPNAGNQTQSVPVTLGGVTLDFDAVLGFDIPAGITVSTNNSAAVGRGIAVLTVGGSTAAYAINLSTGAATLLAATSASAGLTLADTPPGAIGFAASSATAPEGGMAVVTLNRLGGTVGILTATVTVVGGTAVAGVDYNGVPATVTFADGQTTATVVVTLPENPSASDDRTLILGLAGPTGSAVFASPSVFTLTIQDITPDPELVGYPQFGAGQDVGGGAVTVYNPNQSVLFSTPPFGGFTGGVRVAVADINMDGVPDLIAGTGPGVTARVRILSGTDQTELFAIDPFGSDFSGGVFVAAGDINGDGIPDIVITPDQTGGPRVLVINGKNFTQLADFFGIDDPDFRGGVRASVGDVNGDGFADIAVAAGFSGGPRVALYSGITVSLGVQPEKLLPDFFAFEPGLRNGVYVALGDVNGDGFADIIAGAGPGGGPRVLIVNGKSALTAGTVDLIANPGLVMANFFAGNTDNRGGIRVAVKDLDGDQFADLITGPGEGNGSQLSAYFGTNLQKNVAAVAFQFDAYPGFLGGLYVG